MGFDERLSVGDKRCDRGVRLGSDIPLEFLFNVELGAKGHLSPYQGGGSPGAAGT
jgi:hypothetical protein